MNTNLILLLFTLITQDIVESLLECEFTAGKWCEWRPNPLNVWNIGTVRPINGIEWPSQPPGGSYAYIQGQNIRLADARLISPLIKPQPKTLALSFAYRKTLTASLDVCVLQESDDSLLCLDTISGSGDTVWNTHTVTIPTQSVPFKIVLRVRNLRSQEDVIAIDSIQLSPPVSAISASFADKSTEDSTGLRKGLRRVVISKETVTGSCAALKCTFLDSSCSWNLGRSWQRLEGNLAMDSPGEDSVLSEPFLVPVGAFFEMDVWMSEGARISVLEQGGARISDADVIIWSRKGLAAGLGWHKVRIPIDANKDDVRIRLRANIPSNNFVTLTNTKLVNTDGNEIGCKKGTDMSSIDPARILTERLTAHQKIANETFSVSSSYANRKTGLSSRIRPQISHRTSSSRLFSSSGEEDSRRFGEEKEGFKTGRARTWDSEKKNGDSLWKSSEYGGTLTSRTLGERILSGRDGDGDKRDETRDRDQFSRHLEGNSRLNSEFRGSGRDFDRFSTEDVQGNAVNRRVEPIINPMFAAPIRGKSVGGLGLGFTDIRYPTPDKSKMDTMWSTGNRHSSEEAGRFREISTRIIDPSPSSGVFEKTDSNLGVPTRNRADGMVLTRLGGQKTSSKDEKLTLNVLQNGFRGPETNRGREGGKTELSNVLSRIGAEPGLETQLRNMAKQFGFDHITGEQGIELIKRLMPILKPGADSKLGKSSGNVEQSSGNVLHGMQPIQPVNAPKKGSSPLNELKALGSLLPRGILPAGMDGDVLKKLSSLLTPPTLRSDSQRPFAKHNLDFIVQNANSG